MPFRTGASRLLCIRQTLRFKGLIAHLEWAMELPILQSFAHSIFAHRGAFFLNRAGDFHRARLIRGWLSATGIAPDFVIPHSPQLPPNKSEGIFRGAQSSSE
jgi:hypothetical protein